MTQKKKEQFKDWREARRIRAWELKHQGWGQSQIAEALGISKGASQWLKRATAGGRTALVGRTGGGPKPGLSLEQLKQVPQLLNKGAEAYGF